MFDKERVSMVGWGIPVLKAETRVKTLEKLCSLSPPPPPSTPLHPHSLLSSFLITYAIPTLPFPKSRLFLTLPHPLLCCSHSLLQPLSPPSPFVVLVFSTSCEVSLLLTVKVKSTVQK